MDEINGINVEKILEEIRAGLPPEEEGWKELRFEDIPAEGGRSSEEGEGGFERKELEKAVAAAAGGWEVNFFRPIPGGRIKGFFKRLVRKLIRFCVEPVTLEVTAFNRTAVSALHFLSRFAREAELRFRRQEAELEALRREVDELRAELHKEEQA